MRDLVVLCYHALSEDWPARLCIHPQRFERQLGLLIERGYEGRTFSAAVLDPRPGRQVVVTFDDAFRSVRERAYPIMARLGVPGTVFAVTGFADEGKPLAWDGIRPWQGGPYSDELRSMSWDELRELASAGWEVGSHTVTHPRLTRLADRELAGELRASRERCSEAIGRDCAAIAYPYGDVDERVISAVATAGYSAGAALPSGLYRGRELEWPRVGVYRDDDLHRFRLKVSRSVRAIRALVHR